MATHVVKSSILEGSRNEGDSDSLGSDEEFENMDDDYGGGNSEDSHSFQGSDLNSDSNEETEQDNSNVNGNFGWADAMSKVLHASKPKSKKSVILAKAKKDIDVIRSLQKKTEVPSFEIEGEIKEEPSVKEKPKVTFKEAQAEKLLRRQRQKDWDLIARVKPDITVDRERERLLTKIATKGVVQLFNAVRVQQKNIRSKLQEAGPLERKREKVLTSLDKKEFLDLLTNPGTKIKTEVKEEPVKVKEEKPCSGWSVLRDDFVPEVRMRDWDKEESSNSDNSS